MPRGGSKPGERRGGRGKGTPNKVSVEFRETVRRVLEDNSQNVGLWLSIVAKEDPGKALDLLAKLAEFAAPKLGRVETHHTGAVGTYAAQPIPVEQRDSDALEGAAGPPANSHSNGSH